MKNQKKTEKSKNMSKKTEENHPEETKAAPEAAQTDPGGPQEDQAHPLDHPPGGMTWAESEAPLTPPEALPAFEQPGKPGKPGRPRLLESERLERKMDRRAREAEERTKAREAREAREAEQRAAIRGQVEQMLRLVVRASSALLAGQLPPELAGEEQEALVGAWLPVASEAFGSEVTPLTAALLVTGAILVPRIAARAAGVQLLPPVDQ